MRRPGGLTLAALMAGPTSSSRRGRAALAFVLVATLAVPLGLSSSAGGARLAAKTCNGQDATIVGSRGGDVGNDALEGTPRRDIIVGRGGNDAIEGNRGNDLICGGAGNDFIKGEKGHDRIFGDSGNDILLGGTGDDDLFGGNGDDGMNGQGGRDVCGGGSGDDIAVKDGCETIRSARGI